MDLREKAMNTALRKLNARMRTEKEIRLFLREKEFDEEIIASVVEDLKEYKYIDDRRYCKEFFAYGKRKGKASFRILKELALKGVDEGLARMVIEELQEEASLLGKSEINDGSEHQDEHEFPNKTEYQNWDDQSSALEVGRKMWRQQWADGKDFDERFQAKVARRLAGLGYNSSAIYSVLGKLKQEKEE